MSLALLYWQVIEKPYVFLVTQLGLPLPPQAMLIYKVIVTFVVLLFVYRALSAVVGSIRSRGRTGGLVSDADARALLEGDEHMQSIEAAKNIDRTVLIFRKAKQWEKVADAYASVSRYKDAAKWYRKARNNPRAAVMWAKAGKVLKAAHILMKEGDYVNAARYYEEVERPADAAKAHEKAGNLAMAAAAFERGGKPGEAVRAYGEYFARTKDDPKAQAAAADACLKLLASEAGQKKVSEDQAAQLLPTLAQRLEMGESFTKAAEVYIKCNEWARAGEVYLKAGQLREAAECMRKAGREREAAAIGGRYHESRGNWKEAALSYAAAGEYLKSGECHAKAGDALNAADCFERDTAFFRAGVAYAHAKKFVEGIRVLQQVKEDDPNFDASRALLGRCFFEQQQYYDAAAALENHLTGKRIGSANKEYFYMLALAYEKTNRLEESRDVLRKLHTVDTAYKDVKSRISALSSHISSISSPSSAGQPTVATPMTPDNNNLKTIQDTLGTRYEIEEELGRGGMGVVFRARDTQLDRPVALKFIGSLIDNSEEFRERFVREAKAAAKISHPNIIGIYDISASFGKAYIAMEYVDGGSLAGLLSKRGKLSPKDGVNIIGQACAALAAIHEAGIVHRDIKPDNILIAKGGVVKLTDFGLAKSNDQRLTRTGTAMGTPAYMSPEQVLGKEADARSDVYSLGLVLYETLSGETYFIEGNVLERQLTEMPVPPSEKIQGVPPKLDAVVLKCVAKKPEDRYPSARALLNDLRTCLTE